MGFGAQNVSGVFAVKRCEEVKRLSPPNPPFNRCTADSADAADLAVRVSNGVTWC